MTIENKFTTAKIKMGYVVTLAVIVSLSIYHALEWNRPNTSAALSITISLLIFLYLSGLIIRLNYLFVSHANNKITVRYYSAHPFFRKYKAFEIPTSYFYTYRIETSLGGLKKELFIISKNNNGTFNFPPVSFSAFNKNKSTALIKLLDSLDKSK